MEVVESKKFTTKFGNKVNLVIRAGSMTARNEKIEIARQSLICMCILALSGLCLQRLYFKLLKYATKLLQINTHFLFTNQG